MPDERETALRDYFHKRVECYSQAYFGKNATGLRNIIYRLAWFPLRLIFRHTMQYLSELEPLTVLDVGCGNGVYSLELGRRGAYVTAVDSCGAMVSAAEVLMEKYSIGDRVELLCADYLEWAGNAAGAEYELVLAIGVLDYAETPDRYLTSFRDLAQHSIITFPAKSVFVCVGNLLYRKHGIRAFAYSRAEIEQLLDQTGLEIVCFKKIFPSTYWVHARPNGRPSLLLHTNPAPSLKQEPGSKACSEEEG
jgi:2-polyprenyl-3-methyl-5-hydroxy-6-metoxy-1,4-benzoquinol methylase